MKYYPEPHALWGVIVGLVAGWLILLILAPPALRRVGLILTGLILLLLAMILIAAILVASNRDDR